MAKTPVIGIDLGTTYSCVAVFQDGKVEIIANECGNRTTPSYVSFDEDGRLIGEAAEFNAAINPENTVFDAKRLIGRRFNDPCVQNDMKHWPFRVVNDAGRPKIQVEFRGEQKSFSPEQISSMVLTKMREIAEAYLGQAVKDAVITVPAYFNHSQRQATIDAGHIAGLNVLSIIDEPTAAALAYGFDKRASTSGVNNVLVFDLGGGTFDVSVLSIEGSVFEVKATAGDTHLGGEDFVSRMVEHFIAEFRRKHQKDVTENARALRRLRSMCEHAKRTLSSTTHVAVQLDLLFEGIDFHTAFTRSEFQELCSDLFSSTVEIVEGALKDAKMSKSDIHDIVLVGGSTRIPCIEEILRNFFNGKVVNKSIDPDEAVAHGAAIKAAMLGDDVPPEVGDLVLFNVIPLSLGIEQPGGVMGTVIKRNTRIPCRRTKMSTTSVDNQRTIEIQVFQGERAMVKDNHKLGSFILSGLAPAPKGVPRVEITFDVDADGIIKVSAVDKAAGVGSQITITHGEGGLSEDDIQSMVADAEQYREDDRKLKESVAAKNALERFCFSLKRKFETDYAKIADKVSESERSSVLQRVEETLQWFKVKQLFDAKSYEFKQKELELHCRPIMLKI